MENIENHIKESIKLRSTEILNDIAATNLQYKRLTKQIMQQETELNQLLTIDERRVMEKYQELFLQREALIVDLIVLGIVIHR